MVLYLACVFAGVLIGGSMGVWLTATGRIAIDGPKGKPKEEPPKEAPKRKKSAPPSEALLLYDGDLARLMPCKKSPGGIDIGEEYELPEGVIKPVVWQPPAVDLTGVQVLYIAGVERVALATHEMLDRQRRGLLNRSLLESEGGGTMQLLRSAALVVPLLGIAFLIMTMFGLQDQVRTQGQSLGRLDAVFTRPLVVDNQQVLARIEEVCKP